MPSLQGQKFINRERPRSQLPPTISMANFVDSWHGAQAKPRDLLPMLLDRGFEASSKQRTPDHRRTSDLKPLLRRAESTRAELLADLPAAQLLTTEPPGAACCRSASAPHLPGRVGSPQLGSRQLSRQLSRQSMAQLYGEEEVRSGGVPAAAEVEERLRQKLGQRAREAQQRARARRQRADSHGIFDPAVNRSVAHHARTYVKQQVSEQAACVLAAHLPLATFTGCARRAPACASCVGRPRSRSCAARPDPNCCR